MRKIRIVLKLISVAVLLFAMVFMRSHDLEADLPWFWYGDLSVFGHGARPYGRDDRPASFDEARALGGVRNLVLFHKWEFHQRELPYLKYEAPLGWSPYLAVFKLCAPGQVQARAVSVVFGVLTVLLLAAIAGQIGGRPAAFFCLLLTGFSFLAAMLSRHALLDIPALFAVALATALLFAGLRFRSAMLPAGIAAFIPYVTKPVMFFQFGMLGAFWVAMFIRGRRWNRSIAAGDFRGAFRLWALGFLAALAVWAAVVAVPYWDRVFRVQGQAAKAYFDVRELVAACLTFFEYNFFSWMPVVAVLGAVYAFRLLLKGAKEIVLRIPADELLLLLWGLSSIAFWMLTRFRSHRYLLSIGQPCFVMASVLLGRMWSPETHERRRSDTPSRISPAKSPGDPGGAVSCETTRECPDKSAPRISLLSLVWLLFCVYGFVFMVVQRWWPGLPVIVASALVTCLAGLLVVAFRHQLQRFGSAFSTGVRGRKAVIAVIAVALLFDACLFVQWYSGRTYLTIDGSRRLGEILPAGSVVVGSGYAGSLALDNGLYFPFYVAGMEKDPSIFHEVAVSLFGATHFLMTREHAAAFERGEELKELQGRLVHICDIVVAPAVLCLYKIEPERCHD